ncbi:MAG: hypothetical protein WCP89_00380 [archaeon]
MVKNKFIPDKITFFINRYDPENDYYRELLNRTGVNFYIFPAEDGPIVWFRYNDPKMGEPMQYGPTAVKYCLERLVDLAEGKK